MQCVSLIILGKNVLINTIRANLRTVSLPTFAVIYSTITRLNPIILTQFNNNLIYSIKSNI